MTEQARHIDRILEGKDKWNLVNQLQTELVVHMDAMENAYEVSRILSEIVPIKNFDNDALKTFVKFGFEPPKMGDFAVTCRGNFGKYELYIVKFLENVIPKDFLLISEKDKEPECRVEFGPGQTLSMYNQGRGGSFAIVIDTESIRYSIEYSHDSGEISTVFKPQNIQLIDD